MAYGVFRSRPQPQPPAPADALLFGQPGAAPLAGTATGTASLSSGSLTTSISLTGTATGAASGSATLTTHIPLSGTATGTGSGSASLGSALSGSATGTASGTATLTTNIPLAGSATGTASGPGSLSTSIPLAGTASGTGSAAGTLGTNIPLAGAATGTASGPGSLTTHIPLSGTATGTASGTLSGGLTGTATGSGAVSSGTLTVGTVLAGMPIISRGQAVYKNGTLDATGSTLVDATYGSYYAVVGGNSYVLDLGATTYGPVLINWWVGQNTTAYYPSLVAENQQGGLGNYLLQKSANLTGPWTTIEDHTSTANPYTSKIVRADMAGYRYLQWTSITLSGTPGALQVNVHDARNQTGWGPDALFIAGDSWSAEGQNKNDALSSGNANAQWSQLALQQQAQRKRGNPTATEPLIVDGGIGGITVSGTGGYTNNRVELLADYAAAGGRWVGIQLGTNDANTSTFTGAQVTQYQTDLLTLIDYIISLGMRPILATIPWGNNTQAGTSVATNANTLNTSVITPLWGTVRTASNGYSAVVAQGPDLYAFFNTHQGLITNNTSGGGLHPSHDDGTATATDPAVWANNGLTVLDSESGAYLVGYEWVQRLWRDALMTTMYASTGMALAGTATGSAAGSSATLGLGLSGTATGTASPSTGTLTTSIPLAGTAIGAASPSAGTLSTGVPLSGTATGAGSASATLGTNIPLTGTATGSGSASATLGTGVLLSGTATGSASGSVTLTTHIPLAGTATGTASGTGSLATGLTGTATGTASGSATLTTSIPLAGTATGAASGSGTLGTHASLAGTATGAAGSSATLGTNVSLSGTANSAGSAAGSLTVNVALGGVALGTAEAVAALTTYVVLAGTATGSAAGSRGNLNPPYLIPFFGRDSGSGSLNRTNSAAGTLQRTNTG